MRQAHHYHAVRCVGYWEPVCFQYRELQNTTYIACELATYDCQIHSVHCNLPDCDVNLTMASGFTECIVTCLTVM